MNKIFSFILALGIVLAANMQSSFAGGPTPKEIVVLRGVGKIARGEKPSLLEQSVLNAVGMGNLTQAGAAKLEGKPDLMRKVVAEQFRKISESNKYAGKDVIARIEAAVKANRVLEPKLVEASQMAMKDTAKAGSEYAPAKAEAPMARREAPSQAGNSSRLAERNQLANELDARANNALTEYREDISAFAEMVRRGEVELSNTECLEFADAELANLYRVESGKDAPREQADKAPGCRKLGAFAAGIYSIQRGAQAITRKMADFAKARLASARQVCKNAPSLQTWNQILRDDRGGACAFAGAR